ncbi:MAG TPA: hypothetical protein VHO48_15545, partial [Anaerolineaceae bacterium]|nr:hypothetical protein [Anaerolineaceae bacterium]
ARPQRLPLRHHDRPPAAGAGQSIGCQLSVISHRLPVVGRQFTVISRQLSALDSQVIEMNGNKSIESLRRKKPGIRVDD